MFQVPLFSWFGGGEKGGGVRAGGGGGGSVFIEIKRGGVPEEPGARMSAGRLGGSLSFIFSGPKLSPSFLMIRQGRNFPEWILGKKFP